MAEIDSVVIGHSRTLKDGDFFIWVIDLLVEKSQRGKSVGRQLTEYLLTAYPGLEVYVLSDEDRYYQKLGYAKEGSIFKVCPRNDRS